MTWWPFSGSGSSSNAPTQAQQSSSAPKPRATTSQSQSATAASHTTTVTSPPSSAPHDPDFYAAHPHLTPPSLPSNTVYSHSGASDLDDDFDPNLPRTMSCRAAFDSAFYCSSLGGHFNDIYRYGQLRSCSEHWSDFWFCMRTKNSYSSADVKERIIQDRYREKEKKLMGGPNSENVWQRRKPGEQAMGAFAVSHDDASSSS